MSEHCEACDGKGYWERMRGPKVEETGTCEECDGFGVVPSEDEETEDGQD